MTYEPTLLTDKNRLKEIYALRVEAWENSEKREFVNQELFPNGWFDDLDDNAFHWVIINEHNKIIAAARLNIFNSLSKLPYKEFVKSIEFPTSIPFAFYSRLIVAKDYQGKGLSTKLDTVNLINHTNENFNWWYMFATKERETSLLNKLNYEHLGDCMVNYHSSTKPHIVGVYLKERRL